MSPPMNSAAIWTSPPRGMPVVPRTRHSATAMPASTRYPNVIAPACAPIPSPGTIEVPAANPTWSSTPTIAP